MWGNNIVLPPCAGIVLAEDLVTLTITCNTEFGTGEILSGAASPTTSKHTSTAVTTGPTTHHTTAKSTTEPPTTPHHNITNSTTEAPTTPHHNITIPTTRTSNYPSSQRNKFHHRSANYPSSQRNKFHHRSANYYCYNASSSNHSSCPQPNCWKLQREVWQCHVCLLAKMGLQFSFKMSAVGAICLCRGTQELKFLILCEAITHLQVLFVVF